METTDSSSYEDKGVNEKAMMAVGSNSTGINDETLDLCLGQVGMLKQRVGLTFSCFDLPNLDRNSKTDAFIVLWKINNRGMKEQWELNQPFENLVKQRTQSTWQIAQVFRTRPNKS